MKTDQQVFCLTDQSGFSSLKLSSMPVSEPLEGEVLIKQTAIGINFCDSQYASGRLQLPSASFIPGIEAVGQIVALGQGVSAYKVGQRVGYATVDGGAFSRYRVIKDTKIFPLHDAVSNEAAVINLTKGMTAHYLLRRTFFVRPKMKILIHGALSRVAIMMLKLGQHYGCQVYGTVDGQQRLERAKSMGYDDIFTYQDFDQQIAKNTFNVVYDGIGGDLLARSVKVIQPFGLLVSFGNVLNNFIMPLRQDIAAKSLFITFPELASYKRNSQELHLSALEVFAFIYGGVLPKTAGMCYDFQDLPLAVKSVQERQKVGPIAIIVN